MYNDLFNYLHKKYNINYGGCCFVAYCVAKNLERLKDSFWLIIQYNKQKGNHYCILSKRYGYMNKDNTIKNYIRLKATSDIILQIYKSNNWSRKYNKKNNKHIETIINKTIMKKIKLSWNVSRISDTSVGYCFRHCEVNVHDNSRCVNNDVRVY